VEKNQLFLNQSNAQHIIITKLTAFCFISKW